MYEPNGLPPWLLPIKRRGAWSALGNRLRMLLGDLPPPVRIGCVLLLLVLAASLMGCATTSAPPTNMPSNPEPPPSALPPQPPNYSQSAREAISTWRKRLIEQTAKPAN